MVVPHFHRHKSEEIYGDLFRPPLKCEEGYNYQAPKNNSSQSFCSEGLAPSAKTTLTSSRSVDHHGLWRLRR